MLKLTTTTSAFVNDLLEEIRSPSVTVDRAKEIHKIALACKHLGKALARETNSILIKTIQAQLEWSFEAACKAVAELEVQTELDMGVTFPMIQASINPPNKSTAIVTIQGISQRFAIWKRQVEPAMHEWGIAEIRAARELLEPIAKECDHLDELEASLGDRHMAGKG